MLRPRGEHAVGLLGAGGDQVVHQHGHVRGVAPGHEGIELLLPAGDVQGRPQPLGRGLFVTGGAVDLARQPQTGQSLGLQRAVQLHRVGVVVFDGIAGTHHDGMLQTGDGVDHGLLHVQRQAGGDAVGIDLRAVQAFGLQEDLVPFALGEARHLVLDGGAVAGARALDDPGEQGRAVEAGTDGRMGGLVGPGDVAGHLRQHRAGTTEAEARRRSIAGLFLQFGKIDGRPQQARRGAGLETAQREAQTAQAVGKARSRGITQTAAGQMREADVDEAGQERAGGEQHMPGMEGQALGRAHAGGMAVLFQHLGHGVLPDAQAGRGEQGLLEDLLIGLAVDLGARGAHGRALAHVEGAELDAPGIGPQAHHAAKGVNLAHHVALGQATDGRVAGQIAQTVHIAGDQQHAQAKTGQGHGGLGTGMAAACHDTVKTVLSAA